MRKDISRRSFIKNSTLVLSAVATVIFIYTADIFAASEEKTMIENPANKMDGSESFDNKTAMQISVKSNGKITMFELNNSPAARELYTQLPLTVPVEDYSSNEKIFYPPKKLNTTDTPRADARAGTLAYYAPWGDVVMFYESFGSAAGLYELGHAVSGSENIRGMSGAIQIEKVTAP
jgi:hypothetical protein